MSELHDFHAGVRPGSAHRWLPVPTDADLSALLSLVTGRREEALAGG